MQEPKSVGCVADKTPNRLQELKSLLPEDFNSFVILMRDKYPETPIKDIGEDCGERYKVIRKFSLGLIDNLNELIESSKGLKNYKNEESKTDKASKLEDCETPLAKSFCLGKSLSYCDFCTIFYNGECSTESGLQYLKYKGTITEKIKIPVTGQCVMSSLDFQSQPPQYIKKTDMTYTPKPEDTWKGYCPMPDNSKTELPEGWLTQKGKKSQKGFWKDVEAVKICYCDGRSCPQCWAKNPLNPENIKGIGEEARRVIEKYFPKNEKCDECKAGAKKICNCGYFQPTPIFKPQNLETSTTSKVSKLENAYYQILTECAKEFKAKNELYGDSVFQVRESSLVDKLYAKAKRVITLSKDGVDNKGKVGESIAEDIRAIINYTLIILVLIQNSDSDKCLEYNNMVQKCIEVAEMKDADYGSAWKEYRVETLLDEVFVKVYRLQSLITLKPKGYEDNYFDLINYAIFSLIKLK